MVIGIPNGLLFCVYREFARTFFSALGAEVIVSPGTDKSILDAGVCGCEGEACLPVKLFCGHAAWLSGRCDAVLVPRLMRVTKRQSVCPMFCGLPELVRKAVGNVRLIDTPIWALEGRKLWLWADMAAHAAMEHPRKTDNAFDQAVAAQRTAPSGIRDTGYPHTVALIGHAYNAFDPFVNMDLIRKLRAMGIGVVTHESVADMEIDAQMDSLTKKPFWYFAQRYYGAALHLCRSGAVAGIIYLSAFGCGVDSVMSALIKDAVKGFPMMVLKLDEHTGEAGFDTRLEAFAEMLQRRTTSGYHNTAAGQYAHGHAGAV